MTLPPMATVAVACDRNVLARAAVVARIEDHRHRPHALAVRCGDEVPQPAGARMALGWPKKCQLAHVYSTIPMGIQR